MPDDDDTLVRRMIGDHSTAAEEIRLRARSAGNPVILVAAALQSDDPAALLERAGALAVTPRDRQLVVIATAHLAGDQDRLDALVRDHLADHPDNVLAAWIAAQPARPHL
ncbi:MAG: hypothetical protein ABWY33_10005 [Cellulomonas sp.]